MYLLFCHVLKAEELLGIVIADNCPAHPSNQQLKAIGHKWTSNQIIELSLKALHSPIPIPDRIVHIVLIVRKVVSNRSSSSSLNLKEEEISVIVVGFTVYLWSNAHLVVQKKIVVMVNQRRYMRLVAFSHKPIIELLFGHCNKTLHDLSSLH